MKFGVLSLAVVLLCNAQLSCVTKAKAKKAKQVQNTRTLYRIIRQELQHQYAERLIELLQGDPQNIKRSRSLEYALGYALHIKASLAVIKALITIAQANVNAVDPRSVFSPLMTAIDSGSPLAVVRYLIENKADVNYISYSQSAPLVVAALRREPKDRAAITQVLVCNGANTDFALKMADIYDSYAETNTDIEQSEQWKEMADDVRRRVGAAQQARIKGACLKEAASLST